MSPARTGLAVAALTACLWQVGALVPLYAEGTTSLDLQWYFLAVYEAFFGALRAGTPMLWNPYQLCGMPWLGTLQGGFFYPPHVLYVLLPAPVALAASTVLHLALAAGGTAAFARQAGLSAAAATLAAALFTFAGLMRNLQLWPYLLESSAWIPIGALAIVDLTAGRIPRGALVLGFASGMSWLAGSPQATVIAWYAWGALFLARLALARPPLRDVARATGGVAGGLALGILLGAAALMPAFELAREGVRQTSDLDVRAMYPLGVPSLRRTWELWFDSGSRALLLTALALVPFALFSGRTALVLWGLGVAALAAAFAAGPSTPLFGLYRRLPMLGWFRIPHRTLIAGQFALGLLAGLGLDVVARRIRWRPLAAAAVLILVALTAFEGVGQRRLLPRFYDTTYLPYPRAQRDAYDALRATLGDGRIWAFSPGLAGYSLYPKLPTLTRLRSIDDYEPLALRRQHEYFTFFAEGVRRPPQGSENTLIRSLAARPGFGAPAARRRLLDLASVRLMLVLLPTERRAHIAAFVRDADLGARRPLTESIVAYENPHALPRAFVTYRASPAPSPDELLPLLARASFDPLSESFVEGPGLPADAGAPRRGAAATIVRDDPDVVEIDATLAAAGLVVLADTYYPGWTATVDGVPAPILPTNHLFRGVPAPAGTHRIRFDYRPRSVALGAALSLLTAVALAVGAYRLKARSAA